MCPECAKLKYDYGWGIIMVGCIMENVMVRCSKHQPRHTAARAGCQARLPPPAITQSTCAFRFWQSGHGIIADAAAALCVAACHHCPV